VTEPRGLSFNDFVTGRWMWGSGGSLYLTDGTPGGGMCQQEKTAAKIESVNFVVGRH